MLAFNLRPDVGGRSGVTLEGTAVLEEGLPPAKDFPGYGDEIRRRDCRVGVDAGILLGTIIRWASAST